MVAKWALPVVSLLVPALFMSSACGANCTAMGASSGVEVVITGDAAIATSDTRMDVTTCVRGHCPGTASDISPGERPTFFVEAPWVDSDEPIEVQGDGPRGRAHRGRADYFHDPSRRGPAQRPQLRTD